MHSNLTETLQKRTKPEPSETLKITVESGETITLSNEDWKLGDSGRRIYCILHNNSSPPTAKSFIDGNPLDTVHLPVKTLTASENTEKKTEIIARSPIDIVRYSVVSNTSNNSHNSHNFTGGVIEIWLEEKDGRIWSNGLLSNLLP